MEQPNDSGIVSKVMVLDDGKSGEEIKEFCAGIGLVGIKPAQGQDENVMQVLRSNVDLGGVILYEAYNGNGLALAREIHAFRPELPIFLRRAATASLDDLAPSDKNLFRCAFTDAEIGPLRATLEDSIFSRIYPNDLARGITEMSLRALENLFSHCTIEVSSPYLVKDRIIFGEVFSMIAIESHWCRGYMMFQAETAPMLELMRHSPLYSEEKPTFRELNNDLGEATNLVWGAFKNRYAGKRESAQEVQTQVPIIINMQERYITFGSDDPQLCLSYTLTERSGQVAPVVLMQRFVFNLNWSPEDFSENTSVESLFGAGVVDFF